MKIILSRKIPARTYEARFECLEFSKKKDNQVYFSVLELCKDMNGCTLQDISSYLFGYEEKSPIAEKCINLLIKERLVTKKWISSEKFDYSGLFGFIRQHIIQPLSTTGDERYFPSLIGKIALHKSLFPVRRTRRFSITLTDDPCLTGKILAFHRTGDVRYQREHPNEFLKSDRFFIDTLIQENILFHSLSNQGSEYVLTSREDNLALIYNPDSYAIEIEYNSKNPGTTFLKKNERRISLPDIEIPSGEEVFKIIEKSSNQISINNNTLVYRTSFEKTTPEERSLCEKGITIPPIPCNLPSNNRPVEFSITGTVDLIPSDPKDLIKWVRDDVLRSIREYISPDEYLSRFMTRLNSISSSKKRINPDSYDKFITDCLVNANQKRKDLPDQYWFVHAPWYLSCEVEEL